ncbi:MAG TPA: hypothetical protein IAC83_07820 [Euryarchaeota archaeon]|nr:hypothetical protein [Euryarchaeota archaeon]
MTRQSDKPVIAIAAILIAVILIGEVVVYSSDYTDYSADATLDGGDLSYEVSADGSKTYSVIVNDNGTYGGIDRLYLYYDESYATNYEDVDVSIGAQALDQEYYLKQVVNLLEPRNFKEIVYLDAKQLEEKLSEDVSSGTSGDAGLLVISGALPDTVYTGNSDDSIFEWMSSGGSLYWLGNLIGSCYATTDGLVDVDGYQELFFGTQCLNTEGTDAAYSDIVDNGYRQALSLQSNSVKYAVNPDLLPEDRARLSIGFTEGGYSSITFVQYGEGMVCIIGGDYSNYQRNDVVQIIASGLGPQSKIVAVESGTVTNGTVSGTIENVSGENLSAFIYLGGYYPVYSKLIWL